MPIPVTTVDLHAILMWIFGTGVIGKLGLMAIRTMPPPPGKCNFWCRWMYDFLQQLGDNPDKLGTTRSPVADKQPE